MTKFSLQIHFRKCARPCEASCFAFTFLLFGCEASPTSTPLDPCERPGVICTVVGTGFSLFDNDGRSALDTSLYAPLDVDFDLTGRPLILDWNNLRLRRINNDGTIETIMGNGFEAVPLEGALATDTTLHHASDVAVTSGGELYVAGFHAAFVFRVRIDGRVNIVAGRGDYGYDGDGGPAVQAALGSPFGVFPTSEGGLYFSDVDLHIVRFVDAGGSIMTVAGNGTRGYSGDGGPGVEAQLSGPTRVRLVSDGILLICDTNNNVIRRLDPNGTITTIAGTGESGFTGDGGPAIQATFTRPHDVKIGPDGSIYVADTGNHAIRRIDQSGNITTVVGTGVVGYSGDFGNARDCQLKNPSSITFDADGAMWISDTYNHRVRRVEDPASLIDP